ncbi:hypothetical protein UFOVP1479_7 [uncultured Caudovirales phage]|uniref:Uncharacterized protein n=2 Tax=uncultured Caudovirales phage TaxID=2100421 RepID=A0A6J5N1I7_9CAUD|nr:hypothetical protein UFOVP310_9 [uncultured Caudovirales phage]CAB4152588.1 hypothetical protein UFOVP619_26 [uncultured Caudovirales phage]CAB4172840.1 hypothetical protein UFOVP947_10 [uncultured Caudovirales phage]CAB4203858.1 hypothetical protein UFOVP1386_1 [uncultured Caudovirales phage]CAB4215264.1 hypothetical protein UFOVP1479_7 [uncultured Caudovirales phage]
MRNNKIKDTATEMVVAPQKRKLVRSVFAITRDLLNHQKFQNRNSTDQPKLVELLTNLYNEEVEKKNDRTEKVKKPRVTKSILEKLISDISKSVETLPKAKQTEIQDMINQSGYTVNTITN